MTAYYNEFDPQAAQWLRNLIAAGLIAPGDVDERSIKDVQPDDVRNYAQCHFFAGIGGWSAALRLAGWEDSRPVWTGSCPCPPFSSAGKKKACPECGGCSPVPCPRQTGYFICAICRHAWLADERHLWPELWRLIAECRPAVCFGEQVSGKDGAVWLAGVRASLEILGRTVGASDMPAAGVGAPHIRQRIWWATRLSDAECPGVRHGGRGTNDPAASGVQGRDREWQRVWSDAGAIHGSELLRLGDSECNRLRSGGRTVADEPDKSGHWSLFRWHPCRDGKARRVPCVEPEVLGMVDGLSGDLGPVCPDRFPLAEKTPGRVPKLKGYGNAIVAPLAAEFIQAWMEVTHA